MKTKQFDYDDNLVLLADVRGDEVGALSVILYIKGIDYDITKSFTEKKLAEFESWFSAQLDRENAGLSEAKADFDIDCDQDDVLMRDD